MNTLNDSNLKSRIHPIKVSGVDGECVLYIMSRDQRVNFNHAIVMAQKHAIAKQLPLCVVFCLYEKSGNRAREHFEFMIEGLKEVERNLKQLNIPFMLLIGNPFERLSALFHHTKPVAVYFDFSPLRGPRNLHEKLAAAHDISMYQVDTHNIVPTRIVSQKMEVGAYTLRSKIHKIVAQYLIQPVPIKKHPHPWPGTVASLSSLRKDIATILVSIPKNGVNLGYKSGEKAARDQLDNFIFNKLDHYEIDRNRPDIDGQSNLSPYLHYGQISALEIALELRMEALKYSADLHLIESPKLPQPVDGKSAKLQGIDALIEEMIVRKELADNFCLHNQHYDRLESAPNWAQVSLNKHRADQREHVYTKDQLENAETHDPAWNAAQRQLTQTGKIHGYMRMYWAKKVLEWTNSPEEAIGTLIFLNDHYSIDGGDPNGYAGIMWSVAGVHDRPWIEREVFGVIRYMNYAGLKRKFQIQDYENRWN